MKKAVVFRSSRRFDRFRIKLEEHGVNVTVLDFRSPDWIRYDYTDTQFLIYFPEFTYTSNHPLALNEVHHNLLFIHSRYPSIRMFPDPKIIPYYSDKYRQFLFLQSHNYPIPETYALFDGRALDLADRKLGYPMIIKNRFGAGGDYVFKVQNRRELENYYRLSTMNFFNIGAAKHFLKMMAERVFYYYLVKQKRMAYPFLSSPLLAQKFLTHANDLKTVVGNYKVVEAHWRRKATTNMWKMNIDGGAIGEWSTIPAEPIAISETLARHLGASWINVDIIPIDGKYLISEFSPIWHHYAYKEQPSLVYKDDYNIGIPLERALDLESIIVDSFVLPGMAESQL